MNPNMRGEKLKSVFESLGFKNVETVIASGNVVFDSSSTNTGTLETKIEKAFPTQLGFTSTTIVRSKEEIEVLVKKNPFKGLEQSKKNYLIVTFFKNRQPELCSNVDMSTGRTPDFMRIVEKKYGKEITTRTWNTVGRILKKMQ